MSKYTDIPYSVRGRERKGEKKKSVPLIYLKQLSQQHREEVSIDNHI